MYSSCCEPRGCLRFCLGEERALVLSDLLGDLTGDLDLDLGGLLFTYSVFYVLIAVWDRVTLELG